MNERDKHYINVLQVQALQKYVLNEAERDTSEHESRVEEAVKQLELKYRRIIISLHTAAQLRRQQDVKVQHCN